MSNDPTRYPRREFLGQCAAIPLAAGLAAAAEPMTLLGESAPLESLNLPAVPEAELAREVESLLKLVDPRVLHRYVPLAADKNGWPAWKQASEVHVAEPEDDEFQKRIQELFDHRQHLAGKVGQRVLDRVHQNEACRKLIDQGLARDAIELPRAAKSVRLSLALDEIVFLRNLARLKSVVCRVRLRQRDAGGAINEAVSILKMGTMLIRAECLLVDHLVAIAILGIGSEAVYEAAMARGASDEQARTAIDALAAAKATDEDLRRAYRVEFCRWFLPLVAGLPNKADPRELATRYVAADMTPGFKPVGKQLQEYERSIRQIAILLGGHPNPFDKQATIRLGSELHVQFFAERERPWSKRNRNFGELLQRELSAWPAEIEPDVLVMAGLDNESHPTRRLSDMALSQVRDALRGVDNVLGKYLVAQLTSSVMSTPTLEMHQARLEAKRIRIALRLYESKHGRLPELLEGLVADKQLPEVPLDPFDGERFRFSPERRVIWSIGPDGRNEGAVPDPQNPDGESSEDVGFLSLEEVDLTWRIAKP